MTYERVIIETNNDGVSNKMWQQKEINIDGVLYGMWLRFDIDDKVYSAGKFGKIWKWQNYTSRNKKNMRRRIRISRNTELYDTVRSAFINKFVRGI